MGTAKVVILPFVRALQFSCFVQVRLLKFRRSQSDLERVRVQSNMQNHADKVQTHCLIVKTKTVCFRKVRKTMPELAKHSLHPSLQQSEHSLSRQTNHTRNLSSLRISEQVLVEFKFNHGGLLSATTASSPKAVQTNSLVVFLSRGKSKGPMV